MRQAEAGGEVEGGADARLALGGHLASHKPHEARRDRQTEARTAVAARDGTVRLREGLEDHVQFVGRNADARILRRRVRGGRKKKKKER